MQIDFCHFQHLNFFLKSSINIFNQQPVKRTNSLGRRAGDADFPFGSSWHLFFFFLLKWTWLAPVLSGPGYSGQGFDLSTYVSCSQPHISLNLHKHYKSPCWQRKWTERDSIWICTKPPTWLEKSNLKCIHTTNGIL